MDKDHINGILSNALESMRGKGDFKRIIESIEDKVKLRNLTMFLTYQAKENFDEKDKITLSLLVKLYQEIYNNGDVDSPISDSLYDELYEQNRIINEEEIIGASVSRFSGNKLIRAHQYTDLRGTLDKIHFITDEDKGKDKRKSIEQWVRSIETKIGRSLTDDEARVIITPKWDGISLIFEMDRMNFVDAALTRGDTVRNEAIDVSQLFGKMTFSDISNDNEEYGLKTETIMSHDDFEEFCKVYGRFNNPRSALASILSTDNPDPNEFLPYISIMPILIQDKKTKELFIPKTVTNGDYPVLYGSIKDLNLMRNLIVGMQKGYESSIPYDIDGVVVTLLDDGIRQILGRDNNINKYEFAYKFPASEKKTTIKEVIFSVGALGGITPVAKIEPIIMKGNKIKSINLGSQDILDSLNLREGGEVIIGYDIIPTLRVDETCEPGTGRLFTSISQCPVCNTNLVDDKCVNDDCSSRMIGRIYNYATKMNIGTISIETITTLNEEGLLSSIEDLYHLEDRRHIIENIPGFGTKSVKNILDAINTSRTSETPEYVLLGSLGIHGIGRRIFKKISNIYNISDLMDISTKKDVQKLTIIGGVQEKTALKIIEGIEKNKELIKFLCSRLKVVKGSEQEASKTVCFTKVRDKDFEKFLESNDVAVVDNFTKDIDMLIVPDAQTESSKIDKARKAGIEIVPIKDAYVLFGYTNL